jgi:hypothetical protein
VIFGENQEKYWIVYKVKKPMTVGRENDIITCAPHLETCDLVKGEGHEMCRNIQVRLSQNKLKIPLQYNVCSARYIRYSKHHKHRQAH